MPTRPFVEWYNTPRCEHRNAVHRRSVPEIACYTQVTEDAARKPGEVVQAEARRQASACAGAQEGVSARCDVALEAGPCAQLPGAAARQGRACAA